MIENNPVPRKRGRPPKDQPENDTRDQLIKSGLALLTEYGFTASGIDAIVKNVQVPKGSFYHYFQSKEAFALAVLTAYDDYFSAKLNKHLTNLSYSPFERIGLFVQDAKQGMQRFNFRRGCLVGNLMQESPLLSDVLNDKLRSIMSHWQQQLTTCLETSQVQGEIKSDARPEQLAVLFWSCWEGAVMRAKLFQTTAPLEEFWQFYKQQLLVIDSH